jgi:hypothetical protein
MKLGVCTYCGENRLLTMDHVPPRNLFSAPRPHLVTVPSCKECNQLASKDDEYFKAMLAMRWDTYDHHDVKNEVLPSVLRSYARKEAIGYTKALVAGIKEVDVRTPAGLHLGKGATYDVDLERLGRVVNRTVRGLYFHEQGIALPTDADVQTFAEDGLVGVESTAQGNLKSIILQLYSKPPKVIGQNTLKYWVDFTRNVDFVSVWVLTFYEKVSFVTVTHKPIIAELID